MTSETPQPANIGDVHSNEPGSGARYNAGKPAFELVPLVALEDCAKVFDYGRQKYAPWNWAKGMPWSAPLGCLLRHLSAWQRGEDNDPESGLPHLGHVMANLVMLTTYARTFPQGDDRTPWLRAAAADGAAPSVDKDTLYRACQLAKEHHIPFQSAIAIEDASAKESRVRAGCLAEQVARAQDHAKIDAALIDSADRAAYPARWANAPADATHLAQDRDALCHFWSAEPTMVKGVWLGAANTSLGRAGRNLLYSIRCEPRPQVQP